jgi:hypothetical protein
MLESYAKRQKNAQGRRDLNVSSHDVNSQKMHVFVFHAYDSLVVAYTLTHPYSVRLEQMRSGSLILQT